VDGIIPERVPSPERGMTKGVGIVWNSGEIALKARF
jgi:hypothetical protein